MMAFALMPDKKWRCGSCMPVPVLSLCRSSSASESSTSSTSRPCGANFWKSRSHTVSRSDQIMLKSRSRTACAPVYWFTDTQHCKDSRQSKNSWQLHSQPASRSDQIMHLEPEPPAPSTLLNHVNGTHPAPAVTQALRPVLLILKELCHLEELKRPHPQIISASDGGRLQRYLQVQGSRARHL